MRRMLVLCLGPLGTWAPPDAASAQGPAATVAPASGLAAVRRVRISATGLPA